MANTTVEVTREDIDQAARKDSSRCVVATAIARTFPKASRITVDVHSIKFTDGQRRYTYLTPHRVMDYIVAYDAGDTLHPFRFQLRTDQRMTQQRTTRTAKGAAAAGAAQKAKNRRRVLDKVTDDPTATPAQIEVAADRYAEAVAARDAVRQVPGPQTHPEDVSDVPPAEVKPRQVKGRSTVFYRNRREYGQRVMRVNQHDDQPGDFRGPLDD